MSSDSISKDELEEALQAAVQQKSSDYVNFFALHFRWEDDNTRSDRDGDSFKAFAHLLSFNDIKTYIIPKSDVTPGFRLNVVVHNLVIKALESTGKSIVLLHYVGHGTATDTGELLLSSRSGKNINASNIISLVTSISDDMPSDAPVDVVFIFDCCYSFVTTRTTDSSSRVVEILSANDQRDPIAFAAGTHNSFTSKLMQEVRYRFRIGQQHAEIADIMGTLQEKSPVKTPSYARKIGKGSIVLPLSSSPGMVIPTINLPGLLATFSVHVREDFTRQELEAMVEWIQTFPRVKNATFKLENVKATNSLVFIFECSLLSYYRICGLPGMQLICIHKNVDFSWLIHHQSTASSQVTPSGGENMPPQRRTPSKGQH